MASGDILFAFGARDGIPTATLGAAHGIRAGGSTPNEGVPTLAFDDTTAEYVDFFLEMPPHYAGGGVTLSLKWASGATSNATIWQAAFRRVNDDAVDVDTSHSYAFNSVTATTASAAGEWDYCTITFTDGSDMDSVAAGDSFILRISRDATNGSDNMTGDALLVSGSATET